jgi:hypothetical protein
MFEGSFRFAGPECCPNVCDLLCSYARCVESPDPILDTHVNPPSLACSLAACKNRIDFGYVLLVVDDAPIEFDPGVGEERQVLDADHHFGGVAMLLEEARRCRGSLQA